MKKSFVVEQQITISVDESKFTPEFMKSFSEHIQELDSIKEHLEYLVEMYARGIVSSPGDFLEGYGELRDFGVKFSHEGTDVFEN